MRRDSREDRQGTDSRQCSGTEVLGGEIQEEVVISLFKEFSSHREW